MYNSGINSEIIALVFDEARTRFWKSSVKNKVEDMITAMSQRHLIDT